MINVVNENGTKCRVEMNGTGGDLLAEWASATESMFDTLIE